MSCDPTLRRVLLAPSGAVLDLGRGVRLASAAQRAALTARDGGCVIPNCTALPELCDAHHVRFWSESGRTDLNNLALVRAVDHTAIHAGVWSLSLVDGVPWATPPPWIDPLRRRLRNTVHQAQRDAQQLGQQLWLPLRLPPGPVTERGTA